MPGIFDDIVSENSRPAGEACGFLRLIADMPKADRADLDTAMENRNFSTAAIYRALRKNGYTVSVHMIGRHRRKDCSCGKAW